MNDLQAEIETLTPLKRKAVATERPFPESKPISPPLAKSTITSTAPSASVRCRPLRLPDEMLLMIWSHVANLTRAPIEEPALLRTCKTLREKLLGEWLTTLEQHYDALQCQRLDYRGDPAYAMIFAARSMRTFKEVYKVERQVRRKVRIVDDQGLLGEWFKKYFLVGMMEDMRRVCYF